MRAKQIGQSAEYYKLYDILRMLERLTQIASKVTVSSGGLAPSPTTQASNIVTTDITDTSVTFSLTRGNGANVIILARQGSAVNAIPSDATDYTAGPYGIGSQIGTGNYVVYVGSASSMIVTGLTQDTTVYLQAFEFNGSGSTSHYNDLTASGNPSNITTFTTEYQNVIDLANAA